MIRFVYIGDQITEGDAAFAFVNTVNYKFLEFDGEQIFDSYKDFKNYKHKVLYERCKKLIPKEMKY
jgi:hypothetical protein